MLCHLGTSVNDDVALVEVAAVSVGDLGSRRWCPYYCCKCDARQVILITFLR